MTQLIQRVAHLQTGTVDLHVQHVEGSPWNALLWIFFGRERIEELPSSGLLRWFGKTDWRLFRLESTDETRAYERLLRRHRGVEPVGHQICTTRKSRGLYVGPCIPDRGSRHSGSAGWVLDCAEDRAVGHRHGFVCHDDFGDLNVNTRNQTGTRQAYPIIAGATDLKTDQTLLDIIQ